MNSFVTSQIRTYVPIIVGAFVAFLLTQGVALDAESQSGLIVFLTGLLQGLYYFVARVLEKKWPHVGGWLLGSPKQPIYREVK